MHYLGAVLVIPAMIAFVTGYKEKKPEGWIMGVLFLAAFVYITFIAK